MDSDLDFIQVQEVLVRQRSCGFLILPMSVDGIEPMPIEEQELLQESSFIALFCISSNLKGTLRVAFGRPGQVRRVGGG
jgi:hypothetical protein